MQDILAHDCAHLCTYVHACFQSDEPVYAMHTAVVHAEDVCMCRRQLEK